MKALAHISEDGTRTQTVQEHLTGTAKLAGAFAAVFGAQDEAEYTAGTHDIGKYTADFQRRLHGGPPVDHSTAGAQEALRQGNVPAAFAIAGHHSGLPDGGHPRDTDQDSTLMGRARKKVADYSAWKQEITVGRAAPPAWIAADNLTSAFFTRMLYSCLVDADFIDTETFMNGKAAPRGMGQPLPVLLEKVRAQARRYLHAPQASPVAQQRNAVLQACIQRGQTGPQGLYTLTVPTGGGKTFASLAFALEQAAARKMDRVIYVIPYTSIIDQTARTFADLLGEENVLAHFSGVDYKLTEQDSLSPTQYRQLLSSENWDAPVVVTTAVQFFESLYANRSSRCRKLHNIANSVVIFDEAQTLPNDSLKPCISAIAQLVQHYHTTAVLCTATQPALGPLFRELAPGLTAQEISPDPALLYQVLRRVTLRSLGTLSTDALCARLSDAPQVLCVVNRRKTAQDLFAALPAAGSYCLTTLLCAADRRRQLDEIRQRLREGLPCRVVSTSLIEAGVDVDFPLAYREAAGLDSILQTAGRCNREGKRRPEESLVSYFQLEGCPVPQMIRQNVHALAYAARQCDTLDTPEAIHAYFDDLYRSKASLDKKGILAAFQNGIHGSVFPFAWAAEQFHLIETPTRTLYIPIDEGAALCEALRSGHISRAMLRQLGLYSVECYAPQFDALSAAGALECRSDFPDGSAVLIDPSRYDRKTGLNADVPAGEAIFF